ncbi:MAG: hypothetical protein ABJ360_22610 [Roseobacter sp.]
MFILKLIACFQSEGAGVVCDEHIKAGLSSLQDCYEMAAPYHELTAQMSSKASVRIVFIGAQCTWAKAA